MVTTNVRHMSGNGSPTQRDAVSLARVFPGVTQILSNLHFFSFAFYIFTKSTQGT